jgi:PAS domain S-box-containing protein
MSEDDTLEPASPLDPDSEASLRALARRYHELFAQAQDVIYVLDIQGNVLDMNAAGERVTGYSREELLGSPIARLVLPEHLPTMARMLEHKIDGLPITTYELEIQARDGRRVAVEVSSRLVYRGDRPAEIHGIARDITRRKEAQEQQEFLSDVGQVLTSSLDDDAILGQIAALAVPRIADYCLVDIIEPDGRVRRAAGSHAAPERRATLAELAERYPPRDAPLYGVPKVLREGQTIFSPAVRPDELERAAQDERHLELLRTLNPRSAVLVPLRLDGRVGGVITIARTTDERPYTEADVAMAEELARRAAQALNNARLYRAARQARGDAELAARRTALLQELTAALAQTSTPAEIADVVIRHGVAAAGAYAGALVAGSPDSPRLDVLAVSGYPPGVWDSRKPLDRAAPLPITDAARSGEPIWLPTREEYAARYPDTAARSVTRTQALAAIPLCLDDRTIGVLGLSFAAPQSFGEDDRRLLLAMAQQCAQALERARLYAESRAQAERLALLAEAAQAFAASSRDLPALLGLLGERAATTVGDLAAVGLVSEDGEWLEPVALYHPDPEVLVAMRIVFGSARERVGEGLIAGVLLGGEPLLLPDFPLEALRSALPPEHRPYLDRHGLYNLAAVPLRAQGRVFGALSALRNRPGLPYSEEDLALLQDLADRAALAIDNARLYGREQQARSEAEEAVRLRDTFLSVAAHELKTPLTALLGQAQLLQRRDDREGVLAERERRSVDVIVGQARRLNRLTLALLDVTRIQQGRLSLDRAPFDLGALLRQIAQEIGPTLSNHQLHYAAPAEPLPMLGDALRLEQVVLNLIENAVKYSPEGGPITLTLERVGEAARVGVTDAGIGMPAEALPHVFTRFYRAENAASAHIRGMGIGLFVVHEIIALHGGRVEVTSTEGRGSSFTVWLPLGGGEARGA